MNDYKPHYSRPEKEAFFRWLQSQKQMDKKIAQKYISVLTDAERYAKASRYESDQIFASDFAVSFLTLKEFVEDPGFNEFREKVRLKFTGNQVTVENAIGSFLSYGLACLGKGNDSAEWQNSSVLYVHRGTIFCQKEKHSIIPATAVLLGKEGQEARLSVSYCQDCGLFFIQEESYKRYLKQYRVLIGDIRFVKDGREFTGQDFMADVSPLMLRGYNVSQKDGLSEEERHYLISQMIDESYMSKLEIIRYLEFFIRRNGQKDSNYLALSKWERDLDFALHYDENRQKQYLIKTIQKYSGRFKAKK